MRVKSHKLERGSEQQPGFEMLLSNLAIPHCIDDVLQEPTEPMLPTSRLSLQALFRRASAAYDYADNVVAYPHLAARRPTSTRPRCSFLSCMYVSMRVCLYLCRYVCAQMHMRTYVCGCRSMRCSCRHPFSDKCKKSLQKQILCMSVVCVLGSWQAKGADAVLAQVRLLFQ